MVERKIQELEEVEFITKDERIVICTVLNGHVSEECLVRAGGLKLAARETIFCDPHLNMKV